MSEKLKNQPKWLNEVVGMESYNIKIVNAYFAIGTQRPIGKDIPVLMLEYISENANKNNDYDDTSKGYWYYNPITAVDDDYGNPENWYWSGGSVKNVFKKVRDEYILEKSGFFLKKYNSELE